MFQQAGVDKYFLKSNPMITLNISRSEIMTKLFSCYNITLFQGMVKLLVLLITVTFL